LELFSRVPAWKKYSPEMVINGALPDINLKKFQDNFKDIKREIVVEMIKIIVGCIDLDPESGSSTKILVEQLENIQHLAKK
jgi:hypothetical protein